jgi:hypothetical protein
VRFEKSIVCTGGNDTFSSSPWGLKLATPTGGYYHNIYQYFSDLRIIAKGDSDNWYGSNYGSGIISMYAGRSGRLVLIQDGTPYGAPVLTVTGNISANGYATTSDSRIKTNIVDIDDNKALSILRQIQPKTYGYIDKRLRGNDNVIGFIAQEIKAIIPNAVSITKFYIPNFYTNCSISLTDTPNLLQVSSLIDLSWNPLHDLSGNPYLDVNGNACSDASGNKCFKIKLYDLSNNEILCTTTNIIDNNNFLIDILGSKFIDSSGNIILQDEYILYGQEVDDFHTIDKSAIFTVVTSAVQDIDRHQQEDTIKINNINKQVDILTIQNNDLINQNIQLTNQNIQLINDVGQITNKLAILESQIALLLTKSNV